MCVFNRNPQVWKFSYMSATFGFQLLITNYIQRHYYFYDLGALLARILHLKNEKFLMKFCSEFFKKVCLDIVI